MRTCLFSSNDAECLSVHSSGLLDAALQYPSDLRGIARGPETVMKEICLTCTILCT